MSLMPFADYQKLYPNVPNVWLQYQCEALYEILGRIPSIPSPEPGSPPPAINMPYSVLIDPRSSNWEYHWEEQPSQPLPITPITNIYQSRSDEYGLLLVTTIVTDSPDIRLILKFYDPSGNWMQLDNTARELFTLGRVISPTGLGLSVVRYDTAHNVYVIELRPPYPGVAFSKKLLIYAQNEAGATQNMNAANIILAKIS